MRISILPTVHDVGVVLADRIAAAVADASHAVIGLPAGNTPVAAYRALQRRCAAGDLDLSAVFTFNLDEFVGISASHPASFRQFMQRHLFDGVNLSPPRIHFLDGMAGDLDAECARYETAIEKAGGIDLQVLGIGGNGHIGFNEPADQLVAHTHVARLLDSTRRDNAALFGGDVARVPAAALTMGVGTILKARRIVLAATGAAKAGCVGALVHGAVTTRLPASFLQLHRDVELVLDGAAAANV